MAAGRSCEIAARVSAGSGRSVSAGNVEYLLANKLAPQGLVAGAGADQVAARPDPMILSLKLHRTLLTEARVQVVARLLGPLFSPLVVVAALGALAGADLWLVRSGGMLAAFREVLARPLLLLVVLGLSLVSMVFHECGHAAACRYGGARPGRIGMGLYVLWPALFTNVTDSYRLGRAGLRTDLGGVYFNAVFAVVLAGAYRVTGYLPLLVTAGLTQVELAEQLIPSLRLDGYFILTDLIGVPDLFQRIGPVLRSLIPGQPADPRLGALKRGARVALTAWVLAMVPLLGGELLLIVVGIPKLAAGFARSLAANADAVTAHFGRGEVAAGLVSVISVVLLIFPVAGLGYLLVLTGRAAVRLAAAATRKHRMLRLPVAAAAALAAAALAYTWGLLPLPGQPAPGPAPGVAATATPRPAPAPGQPATRPARSALLPSQRRGSVPSAVPVLQPSAYVSPSGSPPVSLLGVPSAAPTPISPEPRAHPRRRAHPHPGLTPVVRAIPVVSPSPGPSDSSSPSSSPLFALSAVLTVALAVTVTVGLVVFLFLAFPVALTVAVGVVFLVLRVFRVFRVLLRLIFRVCLVVTVGDWLTAEKRAGGGGGRDRRVISDLLSAIKGEMFMSTKITGGASWLRGGAMAGVAMIVPLAIPGTASARAARPRPRTPSSTWG